MKICRLTGFCSLLFLLACGSTGEDQGRVLVLGMDGLDPQTVDLLMSEGKMPNFAKLRQEGAYGRLTSQKPLLSPIIWTTIATGKDPSQHGIGHFVATNKETGEEIPVSSQQRKVNALWNIVSAAEKTVATVGWWATWPPEEVNGSVVSDHTAYHFLFEEGLQGNAISDGQGKTYPPELFDRIAPRLRNPKDLGAKELETFVNVSPDELAQSFDFEDDFAHFRWALATAKSYRDIGLDLWREDHPDLELVYIEGTDSASHLFGHLFRAEGLGGELGVQQTKFGQTVEQMYQFADRLLGEYLEAMDDRTTLIVLSDHGFELGALHDDPSKTRDLRRVSERFHRMEGVLYLYGNRVKKNALIDRASILDITPTVLSLLGLPSGKDMPGRVLEEAFSSELPAERIATYEGLARLGGDRKETSVDQAQLAHLRSLGYLGGSQESPVVSESPKSQRNLAAIQFQAGSYREAAKLYEALLRNDPEDASLHTSLAGCLGALGRYDDALVLLDRAITLEPLNAEAYHNRAVVYERRGEVNLAVVDYKNALRYVPGYTASQQALYRLTGTSSVHNPVSEGEARAAELVERASLAARKANYSEAMSWLDEAEAIEPTYVLTYQYRSNVAYLMGDLEAAVVALERGLEFEPDNVLFKTNLERLKSLPDGN